MRARKRAFTLVELMVVIGIIAVLLAMLLPALSRARDAAKTSSTAAALSALEMGLEAFRTDANLQQSFPPSNYRSTSLIGQVQNPATTGIGRGGTIQCTGAYTLYWALAGADSLGTPGFPAGWGDAWNAFFDSSNPSKSGAHALYPPTWSDPAAAGKPVHPRRGPFVELSKFAKPRPVTGSTTGVPQYEVPVGEKTKLFGMCFLDSFGGPILYYRAHRGGVQIATDRLDELNEDPGAVYRLADNTLFTGNTGLGVADGINLGAGRRHRLGDFKASSDLDANGWPTAAKKGSFASYILDTNVTARPTPQRADSYLLISAGADGLYGTGDDVTNFKPNT